MVRSISDADRAGDDEGERQRDRQRIIEQPGVAAADDFLHHEGRVGAEHHHLAMRHVDDAHDAEGDGEADGGQQQHRAERRGRTRRWPRAFCSTPTSNWPLAVSFDFANEHRLGDVVVRQHFGHATGEVGLLDARQRAITLSGSVDFAFSTAFTHMLKPM
jgi:hypothetical protein